MNAKHFIFGEMHDYDSLVMEYRLLEYLTKNNMIDCLLLENAYDLVLDTPGKIKQAIANETWRIDAEQYKMALHFELPVYGIDSSIATIEDLYEEGGSGYSGHEDFDVRERDMMKAIKKYRNKRYLLIVGDTHLRTVRTKYLGPASPIWETYKDDKEYKFIRCNPDHREIDQTLDDPRILTWDDINPMLDNYADTKVIEKTISLGLEDVSSDSNSILLERDPEFIKKHVSVKNDKVVTNAQTIIEFPQWYFEKGLAFQGEKVSFYGIFAMIIDGKYSVSIIPTTMVANPLILGTIKRGDVEYIQMSFAPGDTILESTDVVKEANKSQNMFKDFFMYSNIPWYVSYEDLAKIMNNLMPYAASRIGANPITNELLTSFVTRDATNPSRYYRQTTMKGDLMFVDIMDKFLSVKGTVNRLAGGYFQTGIVSALADPSEKPSNIEVHLKG